MAQWPFNAGPYSMPTGPPMGPPTMQKNFPMKHHAIFEVVAPISVERIYSDEATGAHQDISVWRARVDVIPEGVYMIGDVAFAAHSSNFPQTAVVLVKPLIKCDHLGEIIKPPSSYEDIWDDKGSGGRYNGSFWRVHAPPGFVALGDVACNNWSQPSAEFTAKYACIRKDLLSADAELSSPALWTDKGSGAERDVSVWSVRGYFQPTGYFKAHSAHAKPNLEVFTLPVAKIYGKEYSNDLNIF